jgi:hypothetical protein
VGASRSVTRTLPERQLFGYPGSPRRRRRPHGGAPAAPTRARDAPLYRPPSSGIAAVSTWRAPPDSSVGTAHCSTRCRGSNSRTRRTGRGRSRRTAATTPPRDAPARSPRPPRGRPRGGRRRHAVAEVGATIRSRPQPIGGLGCPDPGPHLSRVRSRQLPPLQRRCEFLAGAAPRSTSTVKTMRIVAAVYTRATAAGHSVSTPRHPSSGTRSCAPAC